MLRRRLSLAPTLSPPLPSSLGRLAERLGRPAAEAAVEPERRWASVALVLVPEPDSVLLIRRAERDGDPWSGQIGLPGGRRGPEDADLVETAIRETAEEVGLDLTRGARLGALDDVVPRTPVLPPIAVRPWVFALDSRPPLALNTEVASAHWVPLAELGRAGVHTHATVSLRGEDRVVAAFRMGDLVVWGMTERILSRFIEVIR